MSNRNLWRLARAGIAVVVLAFVIRAFARNWAEFRQMPLQLDIQAFGIVVAAVVVWLMYLGLIVAWRAFVVDWGQKLTAMEAARIWSVSSLGKYIPGKVWAIAGMAMMARERGVAAWAATGSAILLQVLALGTGAIVVGLTGTAVLEESYPAIRVMLVVLSAASAVVVGLLFYPGVTRQALSRFVPRGEKVRAPAGSVILLGAAANLVAWCGYGVAFWILGRAILPDLPLTVPAAIGAFTASYVAGFLALLAPGGLLVREGVIVLMLQGALGLPAATALAVASRLLLTVTELGIALPFLLFLRERHRVAT